MMKLTEEQYELIRPLMPVQRGNVRIANLDVINAVLYVAENGCKWRALPERFGNWHTIYTRMNRWAKSGVLDRMFEELQKAQVVRIKIEAVSLDLHGGWIRAEEVVGDTVHLWIEMGGITVWRRAVPLDQREAAEQEQGRWLDRLREESSHLTPDGGNTPSDTSAP